MTLKAYWWDPKRPARTLVGELANHGGAWLSLLRSVRRFQNFGDSVNPLILAELTGRKIKWAELGREEVVCVGSVLNAYIRHGGSGYILGSGIRQPAGVVANIPADRVLGVRGLGSAEALGLDEAAAIGDPGLLISTIVMAAPEQPRKPPLFVPHFAMLGSRRGRTLVRALAAAGYAITLPNTDPLEVARDVATSPSVLATSLHALVFADAYGVPCARLAVPWLDEPLFKYEDYRSIFGLGLASVSIDQALAGSTATVNNAAEEERGLISEQLPDVLNRLHEAARPLR